MINSEEAERFIVRGGIASILILLAAGAMIYKLGEWVASSIQY